MCGGALGALSAHPVRNSSKLLRPMKQIPALLRRPAEGRPRAAAAARTAALRAPPIGKQLCAKSGRQRREGGSSASEKRDAPLRPAPAPALTSRTRTWLSADPGTDARKYVWSFVWSTPRRSRGHSLRARGQGGWWVSRRQTSSEVRRRRATAPAGALLGPVRACRRPQGRSSRSGPSPRRPRRGRAPSGGRRRT